jgi:hypothetical protein
MAPTNLGISNIKSLATADPFDGNVSNLLEGVAIARVRALSILRISASNASLVPTASRRASLLR